MQKYVDQYSLPWNIRCIYPELGLSTVNFIIEYMLPVALVAVSLHICQRYTSSEKNYENKRHHSLKYFHSCLAACVKALYKATSASTHCIVKDSKVIIRALCSHADNVRAHFVHSVTASNKSNDWCFKPRICTVRLYWAGDNLGCAGNETEYQVSAGNKTELYR